MYRTLRFKTDAYSASTITSYIKRYCPSITCMTHNGSVVTVTCNDDEYAFLMVHNQDFGASCFIEQLDQDMDIEKVTLSEPTLNQFANKLTQFFNCRADHTGLYMADNNVPQWLQEWIRSNDFGSVQAATACKHILNSIISHSFPRSDRVVSNLESSTAHVLREICPSVEFLVNWMSANVERAWLYTQSVSVPSLENAQNTLKQIMTRSYREYINTCTLSLIKVMEQNNTELIEH